MKYDEFGMRMKQYEAFAEMRLEKKILVAIRLDGKAFHTFTKGLEKPFDRIFSASMQGTMQALCEDIQGCVFGYTQSDEITLILIDYQNPESSAWFDYRVQKMASVAAGLATKYFNYFFRVLTSDIVEKNIHESAEAAIEKINDEDISLLVEDSEEIEALVNAAVSTQFSPYINTLLEKSDEGASFDARCFNIPREEVCNLIYWRQTDAIRNSIQACGQEAFSHKELHGKSCEEIKEMLKKDETPLDWDKDIPIYWQRGCACYKEDYIDTIETKDGLPNIIIRTRWKADRAMPILKGENREYVEKWI